MNAARSKRQDKITTELISDASGKAAKEDGNLKGIGALLFDDDVPITEINEEDVIQRTLNAIGVAYSHVNDELLQPSRIEEERTKDTLRRVRRRSRHASDAPKSSDTGWPPKRKHHKPAPTPEEQLASRHQALVALGMVSDGSDVPTFAREFSRRPVDERKAIIARLDEWAQSNA